MAFVILLFLSSSFFNNLFLQSFSRQPPFNPQYWANRNSQDIQFSELSIPYNYHSLNRNIARGVLINRGNIFPPVLEQEYGFCNIEMLQPNYQLRAYNNQIQNEQELKQHFNSLLNLTRSNHVICDNLNDLSVVNNRSPCDVWQQNVFHNCYEMDAKLPNSLSDSAGTSDNSEQLYEKENQNRWSPAHNINAQRFSNEAAWVNFSNL